MKPNSYETVLKETASPAPDPQARLLAKRAALAEFARVNAEHPPTVDTKTGFFQGLLGALRLSRERQSHGSDDMPWNTRSKMFAGAASVCLAVVGFAVVWPMIKDGDPAFLLEKEPTGSTTAEPTRAGIPAPDSGLSTGAAAGMTREQPGLSANQAAEVKASPGPQPPSMRALKTAPLRKASWRRTTRAGKGAETEEDGRGRGRCRRRQIERADRSGSAAVDIQRR